MRSQRSAFKSSLALLASLALPLSSAYADDEQNPLQIHGYSTLGYSQILSAPNGTTLGVLTKGGTFLQNSLVGLNISYALNEQATFYVQLTAAGSDFFTGAMTNYQVQADMIMLSYRPYDWLDIRLGRQIMPLWMVSEQIDVGVSYPWIAPPSDVYLLAPLKSATGAGFDVKHSLTDSINGTAGIRYADSPYSAQGYSNIYFSHAFIGYAELKFNDMLKLRGSYGSVQTNSTSEASPLATMAATSMPATPVLATSTGAVNFNSKFQFYSAGLDLQTKYAFVMSEYAHTKYQVMSASLVTPVTNTAYAAYDSGIQRLTGYYVTLGTHLGDFTPHFTYSSAHKTYSDYKFAGADTAIASALAGTPAAAFTSAAQAGYKAGFAANYFGDQRDRTIILGLNYNFAPTIVGKVQFQNIRALEGAPQYIIGPTVQKDDNVNIASAALSLVF